MPMVGQKTKQKRLLKGTKIQDDDIEDWGEDEYIQLDREMPPQIQSGSLQATFLENAEKVTESS